MPTVLSAVPTELPERRDGWTLYVADGTERWGADTRAMWVYDQFAAGDDTHPDHPGWVRTLTVPELRHVVREVRRRRRHPDDLELVAAFEARWRGTRVR